jgi:hypothetical protein
MVKFTISSANVITTCTNKEALDLYQARQDRTVLRNMLTRTKYTIFHCGCGLDHKTSPQTDNGQAEELLKVYNERITRLEQARHRVKIIN